MGRTDKVETSKTDLICQLLAAGVDKLTIRNRVGCSQTLVYKVLHEKEAEIARLRAGLPAPSPSVQPPAQPAGTAPIPSGTAHPPDKKAIVPCVQVPLLDPLKPAAPQLEAMAWQVLALAASGGDVTVKQANAAREIVKQALRDKAPSPADRDLRFLIDTIDIEDEKIKVISKATYEVRP